MKGIEIARGYYEDFGKPMLENEFSSVLPYIAVGFTGRGSEHYGFDDAISRDHDFEPGFCIFIPGEDVIDRRTEFLLSRAYAKLPKEYMGIKRQPLSPVGGNRNGVIRTAEYYLSAVGSENGELSDEAWLHIPDYALAEALNGEIWFDGYGEVTKIRENIKNMPEDIKLKRIAGNLLIMAQSGQYNFTRCLKHGEPEAAQLAIGEYVNAAMKVYFLLNGGYMPFYKWGFRTLKQTESGSDFAYKLSLLLKGDNADEENAELKYIMIEDIASDIIDRLHDLNITKAICGDLEKHAYSVNDGIKDGNIRNMNILTCI